MSAWTRLERFCRRASWKAGLAPDRTKWAARRIERVLDTHGRELFEASGVPGMVVIVRFADGRTIARNFGVAGVAGPMRGDTVFPVLSLSKPVTAFCAMALVERGLLALDEPVWRRMRSYRLPAHRSGGFDGDAVTLRRLLSHSAGIEPEGYGWCEGERVPSAKELLEDETDEAHALRIVEPPGSSLRYSGAGFVLAQLLMEDVTGLPFPVLAREQVLRPLGMEGSDYELSPELTARLATSHDDENHPLPARRLRVTAAAAGLHSTAEDLTRFWAVFTPGPDGEPPGRGVISSASCREMLTPQIVGADGTLCGLGFYLRRKRSDLRYTHLGFFDGWDHRVEGLVRRRTVVTILSNGNRGKTCVPPLVRALRATLYDRAF